MRLVWVADHGVGERVGRLRRVHFASRGWLDWLIVVAALTLLLGRGLCGDREQLRCPVAATRHACGGGLICVPIYLFVGKPKDFANEKIGDCQSGIPKEKSFDQVRDALGE